MKRTYRAWVSEGARGFFLTPTLYEPRVVVVGSQVVHPEEPMTGFIVEQTMFEPARDGDLPAGRLARKWIQRADDAVEAGWLTWLTIGVVVTGDADETHGQQEEGGQ